MSWNSRYDYDWRPYIPVAERRRLAAKKIAKLKKAGRKISPVEIAGRKITTTFWGDAWSQNLESYSDYANRLPRGRTYVRNGSLIDLQIEAGRVRALVSGSEIYQVDVKIKRLAKPRWSDIKGQCAGQIDSLVELLQGSISKGVMEIVTRKGKGLFPAPREISLDCSCPDWATMCKHVAATLYGVGARLDHKPELALHPARRRSGRNGGGRDRSAGDCESISKRAGTRTRRAVLGFWCRHRRRSERRTDTEEGEFGDERGSPGKVGGQEDAD